MPGNVLPPTIRPCDGMVAWWRRSLRLGGRPVPEDGPGPERCRRHVRGRRPGDLPIDLATPELVDHARQLLDGEEVADIPDGRIVPDAPERQCSHGRGTSTRPPGVRRPHHRRSATACPRSSRTGSLTSDTYCPWTSAACIEANRRLAAAAVASAAMAAPTSWNRDTLPQGDEKRGRGARHVRRHRAALRPGQPDHDVPPRRALAAAGGPGARPAGRAAGCSTWPAAPATCASTWPRRAPPDVGRPQPGHAARRPQRRAPRAGRHPSPARGRTRPSTASRADSRCATSSTSSAFFVELARVVRPGGRIALLDVGTPRNRDRALGPRRSTSDASYRASAAGCRTPPPTATCPAASPTSRAPAELVAMPRARRLRSVEHHRASGGITQLLTGHPLMRAVTPPPVDADRPRRRRRRRRLPVRARRRRDRRPRRGVRGRPSTMRRPRWRRSTTTTSGPASGPSRSAGCRSSPADAARWSCPVATVRRSAGRWVTVDR